VLQEDQLSQEDHATLRVTEYFAKYVTAELKKIRALYEEKNPTFWQKEIADCNGNTRRLWQTLHGVLGDPVSDESCHHTADDFATFFMDKVDSQSTLILLTVQISLQISSSSQLSVCLTNWRR